MALNLVAPPSLEPVTIDEVQQWTTLDDPEYDAMIDQIIAAARQHFDGRDGTLGRALITQTWDYTIDKFPCRDWIRLPLPPIQSVTSVTYTDTSGVSQTFSGWSLSADVTHRPRIDLTYGSSWPATRDIPDAVTIRFVAGYGSAATDVPQPIRYAIAAMCDHLFEHRTPVSELRLVETPMHVERLIGPYMVSSWNLGS